MRRIRAFGVVAVCVLMLLGGTTQIAGASHHANYRAKPAVRNGANKRAHPNIGAAGSFTSATTRPNLGCSVSGPGGASEIYANNDCGTYVSVDGIAFGPDDQSAGFDPGGYDPVSQTTTGSGTAGDPQVVTTVVDAGDTGVHITQTDTWNGSNAVVTHDTVSDTSGLSHDIQLYRALDCYAGNDDSGYGQFNEPSISTGAIGCQDELENSDPGAQILEWVPVTGGSTVLESDYGSVWDAVESMEPLPNTCQCADNIDNGMAINWPISLSAHGSASIDSRLELDPSGVPPDTSSLAVTSSVTPDTLTPPQSTSTQWTATVTNPSDVDENDVSVHFTVDSGTLNSIYGVVSQGSGCTFTVISGSNASAVDCNLGSVFANPGDEDPGLDATATVAIQTTGVKPPSTIVGSVTTSSDLSGGSTAQSAVSIEAPTPGSTDAFVPPNGKTSTDKIASPSATIIALMKLPKFVRPDTPDSEARYRVHPNASGKVLSAGATINMNRFLQSSDSVLCPANSCFGDIITVAQFSNYTDPADPAKLTLTWDASVVDQNHLGTLYIRFDSTPNDATAVPACGKKVHGVYQTLPCVSKSKVTTTGKKAGQLSITVELLSSNDPSFGRR